MATEAPVIASFQKVAQDPTQPVVMAMMAVPAWAPNAFYQAPLADYQAAGLCDNVWMAAAVGGNAIPWQQNQAGFAGYLPCPPMDGMAMKTPLRPRSWAGYDGAGKSPSSGRAPRKQSMRSCAPSGPVGFDPQTLEQSYVSVLLGNLPKMLCSDKCLEASFEQAHLEGEVVTYEVKLSADGQHGEAVVVLSTGFAAERCIRHFRGMKWTRAQPIMAHYCEDSAGRLLFEKWAASRRSEYTTPRVDKGSNETQMDKESTGFHMSDDEPKSEQEPMKSPSNGAARVGLQEAELKAKISDVQRSPMSSPTKKLWADLSSDDEDDDGISTFAGSRLPSAANISGSDGGDSSE